MSMHYFFFLLLVGAIAAKALNKVIGNWQQATAATAAGEAGRHIAAPLAQGQAYERPISV